MNSGTPENAILLSRRFERAKSWLFVAQSATIDLYKVHEISKEVQSDFDSNVPLRFKDCQKIQAARRMRRKVSILEVQAVCFVFRP